MFCIILISLMRKKFVYKYDFMFPKSSGTKRKKNKLVLFCFTNLNQLVHQGFLFGNVLLGESTHGVPGRIQLYVNATVCQWGNQSSSSTSWNGNGTVLTALNLPALFRCSFSNLEHWDSFLQFICVP